VAQVSFSHGAVGSEGSEEGSGADARELHSNRFIVMRRGTAVVVVSERSTIASALSTRVTRVPVSSAVAGAVSSAGHDSRVTVHEFPVGLQIVWVVQGQNVVGSVVCARSFPQPQNDLGCRKHMGGGLGNNAPFVSIAERICTFPTADEAPEWSTTGPTATM
jgi:hypothetical protein